MQNSSHQLLLRHMLLSFVPNDRPYCRVYNYCNKPYPLYTYDEEAFRKTNSDTDERCRLLYAHTWRLPNHETSFSVTFFFFSCALSFCRCHWLLYARYKKQCMANEAHNGQIWLTCQCREVNKSERGEEGLRKEKEWRSWEIKRLGEVKVRGKKRWILKETEGRWPASYPTTEAAALASAGAAGIRWHATRLAGCDWSRLDQHIHAELW